MELLQQELAPGVVELRAGEPVVGRVGRRAPQLRLVQQDLRPAVGVLGAPLTGVGAAVVLEVELLLPDRRLVEILRRQHRALDRREERFGRALLDPGHPRQVAEPPPGLQHPAGRAAAPVAPAEEIEQVVVDVLLIVDAVGPRDLLGGHVAVVGEVALPGGRRGDEVGEDFRAVGAAPAEGVVGQPVGVVPGHLAGHEMGDARAAQDLRQRPGVAEDVRQPQEAGAPPELRLEGAHPIDQLPHQRLAVRHVGVGLDPHRAGRLPAPLGNARLDPRVELGLVLLDVIVELRLALREVVFGVLLHQPQHRREGARRLAARLRQRPEPGDVDVRVAGHHDPGPRAVPVAGQRLLERRPRRRQRGVEGVRPALPEVDGRQRRVDRPAQEGVVAAGGVEDRQHVVGGAQIGGERVRRRVACDELVLQEPVRLGHPRAECLNRDPPPLAAARLAGQQQIGVPFVDPRERLTVEIGQRLRPGHPHVGGQRRVVAQHHQQQHRLAGPLRRDRDLAVQPGGLVVAAPPPADRQLGPVRPRRRRRPAPPLRRDPQRRQRLAAAVDHALDLGHARGELPHRHVNHRASILARRRAATGAARCRAGRAGARDAARDAGSLSRLATGGMAGRADPRRRAVGARRRGSCGRGGPDGRYCSRSAPRSWRIWRNSRRRSSPREAAHSASTCAIAARAARSTARPRSVCRTMLARPSMGSGTRST